ncbi:MAG TPA: M20/M25/M40 family metallo-hydrolase [Candidatus Polarisedimenticolia bacterium]|jgi:acetylornithine deacetylase/succinyl-diaminopimelate desuccinylase-like protein
MELKGARWLGAAAIAVAAAAAPAAWPAAPAFQSRVPIEKVREATRSLVELASFPSASADGAGVAATADWLRRQFTALGFSTTILAGEGNPLVFARRDVAPGAASVLFYLHYDTQPPGPKEDWGSTEGNPFAPRLLSGRWDAPGVLGLRAEDLDAESMKEARLYARGAADDKAPIVMHLRALQDWLKEPAAARLGLKFILDGEEEAGSPHIRSALQRHADLLKADLLVLCDGPMDALGRPSIYLGARGDMHMKLSVRTAAASGHSGNYGLLPNAAWRLASLLATMKDVSGKVTVEGFFDGVTPPTPSEREALAEASRAEPVIAAQFGVPRFEGDPEIPYYERLVFSPHLIINQLSSGRAGNQIPVVAEALLEARLVTRQDPAHVFAAIRRHVRDRMPDAGIELLDATPAGRMDPSDPVIAHAIAAVGRAAGGPVLVYPSLGGTLPLLDSFASAGYKYVGLPLVNFDNNQHVANENVRVAAIVDGIAFLGKLYRSLAGD